MAMWMHGCVLQNANALELELQGWGWVIVNVSSDNGGEFVRTYVNSEQHCDTERVQGSRLARSVANVAVC